MKPTKDKLKALFKKTQQVAQAEASASSAMPDNRFLKLEIGKSYRFRLLYLPTEKREKPFIELQTHKHYDPKSKKYTRVVCPTSEHILGRGGFDSCPICQANYQLYERKQAGDYQAGELYKQMRRGSENYAVVYVVKDTSVENSMQGECRIIKYPYDVAKKLNLYVLGITQRDMPEPDPDEILGYSAFDLESGIDVIISVGKKSVPELNAVFPEYSVSFSKNATSVPLTEEQLPEIFEKLRFDDLLEPMDKSKLGDFYSKFILGESVESATEEDEVVLPPKATKKNAKPVLEETDDDEEDVPYDEPSIELPKKKSPTKKSAVSKFLEDFDDEEESDEADEELVSPPAKASKKKSKQVVEDDDDWDIPDLDF